MSWTFFKHLWRSQRAKLLIVSVAIFGWSTFLPVIYQSFGSQMKALIDSGVIPKQFTSFGGGDVFSLGGSIALGYIHPISIILVSIFAIGLTTSAVAGERQRGTLEVVLARPLSRRTLYATLFVGVLLFIGIVLAAAIAGTVVGSAASGLLGELAAERLPLLWLNGLLMWGAIAAIGLAASVSFDRLGVTNPYEHERMVELVLDLLRARLGAHVLFSQDVCWRSDYVAYGGRGYAYVLTGLREELRELGVSEEQFQQIVVENPRRALTGAA